jgi:Flp pilus assembly pilin Flp
MWTISRMEARNICVFKKSPFSPLDQRGATAIEYALIIGLIAAVIIVPLTGVGGSLTTLFTSVAAGLP